MSFRLREIGLLGPYIASDVATVKLLKSQSYNLTARGLSMGSRNWAKLFRARAFIAKSVGPAAMVECMMACVAFAKGKPSSAGDDSSRFVIIAMCASVIPKIRLEASMKIGSNEKDLGAR